MIVKRIAAAFLMLGLAAAASAAQLYRWVDEQGNVHYTQQPPPGKGAKKVEEKKLGTKPPTGQQLPYATQQAAKAHPVVLYVAPDCEPCNEGRELLRKRGVPYSETMVQSEEGMRQLRELAGALTVPVLKVGASVLLKGFEATAWHNALDAAGYPKSGPPIPPTPAKEEAPPPPPPPPEEAPKEEPPFPVPGPR